MVRAQSQSVVRGEHPMAFMLPSVSLSEAGSETDSISLSDRSPHPSPYPSLTSLASMTGSSNIYSQSLQLLSPRHSPRPARSRVSPREEDSPSHSGGAGGALGRIGLRLTFRPEISELQVGRG